jgi:hypothetical protein
MSPKFFDPLGRECSFEAWREWKERSDLKIVREFTGEPMIAEGLGTGYRVRLLWNDEPHQVFAEPKVFMLEVCRQDAAGNMNIDAVESSKGWKRLSDAIDGYQDTLVSLGLAERRVDGTLDESSNQSEPTTHELEFTVIDAEEAEEETGVDFDMPALTAAVKEEMALHTDKVGVDFKNMPDGNDAW